MSRPPSTSTWRMRLGGIVLVSNAAQFLAAEAVTASAWSSPRYRYDHNFISDLAVPSCGGTFAGNVICSPRHGVMNISFVAHGLLFAVAAALLAPLLATTGARRAYRGLAVAHGVGFELAAIVPGSPEAAADGTFIWHGVGAALIILGGNVGGVVAGIDLYRHGQRNGRHRPLGIAALCLGIVGLIGVIMLGLRFPPVGAGALERVAIYPIMLVELVVGAALLSGRIPRPSDTMTIGRSSG